MCSTRPFLVAVCEGVLTSDLECGHVLSLLALTLWALFENRVVPFRQVEQRGSVIFRYLTSGGPRGRGVVNVVK
jgi:hypothetical protein